MKHIANPMFAGALALSATLGSALAGTSEPVVMPPPAPAPSSPWEFRITPYAWLTALDGTNGVNYQTAEIDASFSDIFDVLEMAAAAQFEARNGRWGIIGDAFYAKLSDNVTTPGNDYTNANLEMKQFIGELYAAYRLTDSPCGFLDLYAGMRYNYLSLDITADAVDRLSQSPLEDIDESDSKNWIDPIIGIRGRWNFNEKFYFTAKGDIGGFDVGSDLAWVLQGALGYNFTDTISAELGYRYLDTDYKDGGFTYDIAQSGAVIAVNFLF